MDRLRVAKLERAILPPPDPETTTTTLDLPIREEAEAVVAAVLARDLGVTREQFLRDLRKVARRQR